MHRQPRALDGDDEEEKRLKFSDGLRGGFSELASGFPYVTRAARVRANAVFAFVAVFGIGLLAVLILISWESFQWRSTIRAESAAWRGFLKDEIHAMGFAANQPRI